MYNGNAFVLRPLGLVVDYRDQQTPQPQRVYVFDPFRYTSKRRGAARPECSRTGVTILTYVAERADCRVRNRSYAGSAL